ncbi:MAG TPA: hypothetical protein VG890_07540 [Puia sp.]|nr:hypothetical protein [Puia sp.]
MRFSVAPFLLSLFVLSGAEAQETLPDFTVSLQSSGKVLISWKNAYPTLNQISIQRSRDSLRNFTTLLTIPDPHTAENGFVDSKAEGGRMFYRIFILFGNSRYMFTKSRRPVAANVAEAKIQQQQTVARPDVSSEEELIIPKINSARIVYPEEKTSLKRPAVGNPAKIKALTIEVDKTLYVKRRDSVIMQLAGNQVRRFSDSLLKQTKDTLLFVNADTLLIRPFVEPPGEKKEVYKISPYVFTAKDGNVNVALADWNRNKYSVRFFEDDNTPLLEIKEVNNPLLIIDKTNFLHSGWFRFELYENGKLKEKNKLFIPKEF